LSGAISAPSSSRRPDAADVDRRHRLRHRRQLLLGEGRHGFGRTLRGAIFARVEHLSIHQFDRFGSASLVTRTTNDTTQVQMMVIMLLTMVITAPMMAIGGIILAVSQDASSPGC
jgi:ABC-type multidrug transport system fused ATPase/permease subunit